MSCFSRGYLAKAHRFRFATYYNYVGSSTTVSLFVIKQFRRTHRQRIRGSVSMQPFHPSMETNPCWCSIRANHSEKDRPCLFHVFGIVATTWCDELVLTQPADGIAM